MSWKIGQGKIGSDGQRHATDPDSIRKSADNSTGAKVRAYNKALREAARLDRLHRQARRQYDDAGDGDNGYSDADSGL